MPRTSLSRAALAGAVGGVLSGLFGVGGGIVMVPIFVFWLGLDQKRAITTSLVAIVPIAAFGALGYTLGGGVDWPAALGLGVGSIVGGQIGAAMLPHVPVPYLQLLFAALLLYSAYRLAFPSSAAAAPAATTTDLQGWIVLVVAGVAAGVLAGLLGVGGGIILVPALVLLVGTDLNVARGTSLVVVIMTAVTASLANLHAGRTDTRTGVVAGLAGAPASLAASFLGQWLPQRQASVLFALLMVVAALQMVRRALVRWTAERDQTAPGASSAPDG